ncbi:uncharacterized protein LOC128183467 [Crassostrea angulata]|uniref:uncharacterized protein LOC128183467 n=1 Tax=Magallana angulata TaxID=2784310 RepID=UPI0022B0A4EC|nr:uncharacterized protein LOC128183467 [Crassostrea angulata]
MNSSCKVCKQGYNGPNCAFHCRYPNYGMGCQTKCNCEESECNHIAGCMHITIAGSTVTSKSIAENLMTRVSTTPYQATVNVTTNEGILHQIIKWTGLDFTTSIIIFSICLIGIVLSVMLGIYITCNKMDTAEDVYVEVNDITEQKSMPENVTSSL